MDDADALASGLARSFERLAQVSLGGYFQRWPHGRASVDLEDFDLFEFARLVLWESNVPSRSIDDVIRAAEERLQTARFGLEDMSRPERAQSGLYNAVVFGRMVTFALQNLRHIVPEFEDRYDGKVKQMRSDPLMGYFSELRTKIEKQVGRHTSVATHIRQFNLPGDMQRFDRPPPGATKAVQVGKSQRQMDRQRCIMLICRPKLGRSQCIFTQLLETIARFRRHSWLPNIWMEWSGS